MKRRELMLMVAALILGPKSLPGKTDWLKLFAHLKRGERNELFLYPQTIDELIACCFLSEDGERRRALIQILESQNLQPRQLVFGWYGLRQREPLFLPTTSWQIAHYLYRYGSIPVFSSGNITHSVDLTALAYRLPLPARAKRIALIFLRETRKPEGWPDRFGAKRANLTSTFLAGRSLGFSFPKIKALVEDLPQDQKTGPIHEAFSAFLESEIDF